MTTRGGGRHLQGDGVGDIVMIRPKMRQTDKSTPTHIDDVFRVNERALGVLERARSRRIRLRSAGRVHVLEAGEGPPVLFLHGSATSALSFVPLLERLTSVRAFVVDRPGFGLSDPADVPRERFRDAAVEFIDEVLDGLDLRPSALVGGSIGGTLGLWYALARPEHVQRLALIGAAPLLPWTTPPLPLRAMSTPVVGDLLTRITRPNAKMVVRFMSAMGEGATIVRHPDLLEALVATGNDPVASDANLAEVRAIMTPLGFRYAVQLHPEELRQLEIPTLLVWGDHDPVGAVWVAERNASLISEAQLEVLPAGHVPYLGDPDRVSELLSVFVGSSRH